jgi:hypothetical protein
MEQSPNPIELQLILKSQGRSKRYINQVMNETFSDASNRLQKCMDNPKFKKKLEYLKFKEQTQERVYTDIFEDKREFV